MKVQVSQASGGYCRSIGSQQRHAPAVYKETNMYQPGMDQGLAHIRYAEMLEEAARVRAERQMRPAAPKAAARRWMLALAAVAPVALATVWVLAVH